MCQHGNFENSNFNLIQANMSVFGFKWHSYNIILQVHMNLFNLGHVLQGQLRWWTLGTPVVFGEVSHCPNSLKPIFTNNRTNKWNGIGLFTDTKHNICTFEANI